jgi:two-component system, chemotaxis family, protein-glutamate methylesterase/glutaminase
MADFTPKIRVMIVDDSSVYRAMLRGVLEEDPDIDVVAQAVNGKLALPRIKYYNPEIIILDNEMPEMTGLETLEVVKRDFPGVGVIMFSSYTVEGAKVTVRALELGALDFATKPGPKDGDPTVYIKRKLITIIKQIMRQRRGTEPRPSLPERPSFLYEKPLASRIGNYDVCTIGISTGGPAALRILIPLIKGDIKGSILITQHMPPLFTKQLAESLNEISPLKIVEGENGMAIEPRTVYIAPGGRHMIAEKNGTRNIIKILDTPPENNCRPSVNILFRSVAAVYRDRAVGVIMTGMGNDGFEGMKEMKANGAYLIAQNQESCLIFGMPSMPIKEGLVQEELNIEGIAARIGQLMSN